jgi:hypothetical protein
MTFNRKALPLAAILTLLVFVLACQKEVNELQELAAKCRITTGYYYGGSGMMNDSAVFTYTADDKLSRVDRDFEYVRYFYTGNKITKRRFHEKSPTTSSWRIRISCCTIPSSSCMQAWNRISLISTAPTM